MTNDEIKEINVLLKKVSEGDQVAFNQLYEIMAKPTYRFILTFIRNNENAEEITQETFIRVIKKAHMFRYHRNGVAWIFEIAKHLSLNAIKKIKKERDNIEFTELYNKTDETEIIQKIDRDRFIETLDTTNKRIVILKALDLTTAEIAKVLKLSERTVQRHFVLIREKARKYYEGEGYDE